jgi:hypothetical protein
MKSPYTQEFSSGIAITLNYDPALQTITRTPRDPVRMSANTPFWFLLEVVFDVYPEIHRKYSRGGIGFSLNGSMPKSYSPLFDGDVVFFFVPE